MTDIRTPRSPDTTYFLSKLLGVDQEWLEHSVNAIDIHVVMNEPITFEITGLATIPNVARAKGAIKTRAGVLDQKEQTDDDDPHPGPIALTDLHAVD